MVTSIGCSICGQKYLPPQLKAVTGKGKLCPSCYNNLLQEIQADEEGLQATIELLQNKFGLTEISSSWIEVLKTWRKDNKTYFGMYQTINYYFQEHNSSPDPDDGIWFIKYYYNDASVWYKNKQEINTYNAHVDLTPTQIHVTMVPPTSQGRKPKYDISDL